MAALREIRQNKRLEEPTGKSDKISLVSHPLGLIQSLHFGDSTIGPFLLREKGEHGEVRLKGMFTGRCLSFLAGCKRFCVTSGSTLLRDEK